jgi:arsenite methyltransferase
MSLATYERAQYGVDAPGGVGRNDRGRACRPGWRRRRVGQPLADSRLAPGRRRPLQHGESATSFAYTTLRGKFTVWEAELDRLGLAGTESVLDLGCGRGAVLGSRGPAAPRRSSHRHRPLALPGPVRQHVPFGNL